MRYFKTFFRADNEIGKNETALFVPGEKYIRGKNHLISPVIWYNYGDLLTPPKDGYLWNLYEKGTTKMCWHGIHFWSENQLLRPYEQQYNFLSFGNVILEVRPNTKVKEQDGKCVSLSVDVLSVGEPFYEAKEYKTVMCIREFKEFQSHLKRTKA